MFDTGLLFSKSDKVSVDPTVSLAEVLLTDIELSCKTLFTEELVNIFSLESLCIT